MLAGHKAPWNKRDSADAEARRLTPELFTKACIDCKQEKKLTDFYQHSSHWDRRQNRCKMCDSSNSKYRNLARTEAHNTNSERMGCLVCWDQPWRREAVCSGCGLPHTDEDLTEARRAACANRDNWKYP